MTDSTNKRIWYAELDVMLTAATALKAAYVRRGVAVNTEDENNRLRLRRAALERYTAAACETDRDELRARADTITNHLDKFMATHGV